MSDTSAPAPSGFGALDMTASAIATEVSKQSERLIRLQGLQDRTQSVKAKWAEVLKEVSDIQQAWAAEQGLAS